MTTTLKDTMAAVIKEEELLEPPTLLHYVYNENNYRAVMARVLGNTHGMAYAAGDLPGVSVTRAGKRGMSYETRQRLTRPRDAPRTVHFPIRSPLQKSMRPCTVIMTLGISTIVIVASFIVSALYIGGFVFAV
jgi:hypothetical protein